MVVLEKAIPGRRRRRSKEIILIVKLAVEKGSKLTRKEEECD